MNITFKTSFPKKEWTITDDRILCKKKEVLLSKITKVTHERNNSPIGNGVITIIFGSGFFDFLTLPYPYSQNDEGQMAYEYILGIVNGEEAVAEEHKQLNIIKNGYKKRCNVCGHIFCYTLDDLKKNKELKRDSFLSSLSAGAGALTGYYAAANTAAQTTHDLDARVIDYDRCPKCGSKELTDITNEKTEELNKGQQTSLSAADEIKKFKDLLDSGVITQEEFDAKKKQLLGL